ncbi:MAG: hypothetical protein IT514_05055 [Burkholderiales bacterium]|nr:hypothetical protein [Burkholderiales bacterium]
MDRPGSLLASILGIAAVALLAVIVLQNHRGQAAPPMTTPYQAVLLANGQAFFGKLENAGGAYPVLREVYYIRSQVNQETKQVANQLIKRGQEPHGPDYMSLNRAHILLIEPVRPDSQVGKLIDQASKAGAVAPGAGGAAPQAPGR